MKPNDNNVFPLPCLFLFQLLLLPLCARGSHNSRFGHLEGPVLPDNHEGSMLPKLSPLGSLQPFLPLLAPSPLAPFTNTSIPKLSGLCTLNFTTAESLLSVTAVDCWEGFAPVNLQMHLP